MSPPRLFDRALLDRRRHRAARQGPADFLLAHVADEMADRLAAVLRPFARVAEIGSLSPVLARRLAGQVGQEAYWRLGPGAAGPDVVADEEALPLAHADDRPGVDLVLSGLSLGLVNDLPGALVQARRALRPDGLFLGVLAGGATLHELREAFAVAEAELEGGVSPRVAPLAELRDLGGLLQRAGLALPVTDAETLSVRYPHALALAADLRAMGAGNVLAERRRVPLRRATLLRAVELYAERFSDPDGRVRATFELLWMVGWAPHASQQVPLRPGSARARLADALGVREATLGADAPDEG